MPRTHNDITGQRFNHLTAIEYLKGSKWRCRCDCGKEVITTYAALKDGDKKSCGCMRRKPKYDLTGMRFGRLVVKDYAGDGLWNCICDCGNAKKADSWALRHGVTPSCGCRQAELQSARAKTHGESSTRLYRVWGNMHSRCDNPNNDSYKYYGERGIKICPEWSSFEAFRDWAMSHGYDPSSKHRECTLDRIDNDGDYEPSNCRWVSHSVQMRNRRSYRNPRFFRAVELVSADGSVLKSYPSIVDASNDTGCTQEGIQAVCSGKQKTTGGGMRWQYAAN